MAGHRYWRVRAVTCNGNPMAGSELSFCLIAGGPTITQGGNAIASSVYGGGYEAAHMFDGDNNSVWAANGTNGEWIGYDFGAGVSPDIKEVRYRARDGYPGQTPNAFSIEYSDDAITWGQAWGGNFGSFGSGETKTANPSPPIDPGAVPHKWWAIFILTRNDYASGSQAQLRNVPGGADITRTQNAVYDDTGHYSDWGATKLFDGDAGSLAAISGDRITAHFDNALSIEEITWTCRDGGGNNYQVPFTGYVAFSDNGADWTKYWDFNFGNWTPAETRTVTNPGGPPPPPPTGNPQAAQMAVVAVAATNSPPQASQYAVVIPSADIPIPTLGAQSSQIAFVSVSLEYASKSKPRVWNMRALWGFPLLIQGGY